MGIPIEIPGLHTLIPEISDGHIVLVEGGGDPAKSFFVRRVTLSALKGHRAVTFVTSRDRNELKGLLEKESGRPPWEEHGAEILEENAVTDLTPLASSGGFLAVDSFSFLAIGLAGPELAQLLRGLRGRCRDQGTTVVLGTDRGMLEPRAEAVAAHLSDGVVQFHAKEGPEGPVRYLRIPKWTDGRFVDRNIYYDFDGQRIAVDLRSRVL